METGATPQCPQCGADTRVTLEVREHGTEVHRSRRRWCVECAWQSVEPTAAPGH